MGGEQKIELEEKRVWQESRALDHCDVLARILGGGGFQADGMWKRRPAIEIGIAGREPFHPRDGAVYNCWTLI